MKNKIVVFSLVFFAFSLGTSFGQKKVKKAKKAKTEISTVVYNCPMHATVTGKKGAKCKDCGMALVEKKADAKMEMAATKYLCPMRCEGSESTKEGNCPVCKMKLFAQTEIKEEHKGHNH